MKSLSFSKCYCKAVYIYLFLPFFIFLFGWMKIYYALPISLFLFYCIYRMIRDNSLEESLSLQIPGKEKILFIVIIICIWVGISGIGGFAFQTEDHIWRNGMFEALVYEKWPVVKDMDIDGNITTRGMSYYLAFWLPAAALGKVFGISVGLYFQVFWAIVGIFLFYITICYIQKRLVIWPLIVFILFSGMDIVGVYLTGNDMSTISQTIHLEWWSTAFQFSSNTTQLFWVYNQAIPAWLISVFLYIQKSNKFMIFILSTSMLYCTMPFLGLLPLCIYWVLGRNYKEKTSGHIKIWAKDTFTIENIFGGGIIGLLSFFYLLKTSSTTTSKWFPMNNGGWLVYLIFLLVEVGAFFIIIYRYQKKNPLYYILLIWLCLCPILPIYGGNNFCMRASIPALTILYLYVVQAMEEYYILKRKLYFILSIFVLSIGSITPIHEFTHNIAETEQKYFSEAQTVRAESIGLEDIMKNNYESTDTESNLFFKYLSK